MSDSEALATDDTVEFPAITDEILSDDPPAPLWAFDNIADVPEVEHWIAGLLARALKAAPYVIDGFDPDRTTTGVYKTLPGHWRYVCQTDKFCPPDLDGAHGREAMMPLELGEYTGPHASTHDILVRYRVAHAAAVSRQDALEQMLHGHVPSGTEPTHGAVIVSKLPLPKLQWNPFIVATAGNPDPLVSYTFSQLVAIMIEADLLLHQ